MKQELLGGGACAISAPTTTWTRISRRRYRPWRQRIAFIPDGDLFQGIRAGKASIVTDEIERFTETGILLKSGKQLEADIIVTATGFNLNVLGDIDFTIDGEPLVFSDTVTYRGMMFTGVPNMVWVFGYFRASWTLRADLVGDFVCRLLNHMKQKGARRVTPALRPEDADMPLLPWIDPENFNPGYLMRGMHLLPKRGDKPEWQHTQDYWREKDEFPAIDLDDPAFVYAEAQPGSTAPPPATQSLKPPRLRTSVKPMSCSVLPASAARPPPAQYRITGSVLAQRRIVVRRLRISAGLERAAWNGDGTLGLAARLQPRCRRAHRRSRRLLSRPAWRLRRR